MGQMASKCSPALKLERKARKQARFFALASQVEPALKNGNIHVSNMQAGHERMHKAELKSKEVNRKKVAAEKRSKLFGKESEAKKAERNVKEGHHKTFHKHWRAE